MIRILITLTLIFLQIIPAYCDTPQQADKIKETYSIKGHIEYDDNPVETIYLDENIEKPNINNPQKTLTLPVKVLNITSNANTQRSALARAMIRRSTLTDIMPLSGKVATQYSGFSFGQSWEQELSSYAQNESTNAFFLRYDSPKLFSITTSFRQSQSQDVGSQYNTIRIAPEWHITDKLTLKDSYTEYVTFPKKKNELTLVYTPQLKKYAESLKFELGVAQSYYNSGKQTSSFSFSTGFKL